MKGINNMDKYDQHDHLEVLTELTVLYKLANETSAKILARLKYEEQAQN